MAINRRTPPDAKIERRILTGMIISNEFMAGMRSMYAPDCLLAKDSQIIAKWCIDYYDKYEQAPGKHIEDIFRDKKEIDISPEVSDIIEEFLASLSDEYVRGEKFNAGYALDQAEKHFRLAHLQNVKYELSKAVTAGRIEEAEAMLKGFERVARIESKGIDPLRDKKAIKEAFNDNSSEILFRLPGALGNAIGTFERNYLFAVLGAQGIGKTWWLWFIAQQAAFAGYNVVFVSLEMTERQMIQRIQTGITGLPKTKYAGKILIPVWDCKRNQNGACKYKASPVPLLHDEEEGGDALKPSWEQAPKNYIPCCKCKGEKNDRYQVQTWFKQVEREEINAVKAIKKAAKMENFLKRAGHIRLMEYPPKTLTIDELRASLYNLEHYENFVADVLVTDYADEFTVDKRFTQHRHGIGDVWAGHKKIAGERKMLVVTGSQSNTARTGKDIKRGDWAEDISKLGKIDGAMAINKNEEDKGRMISRIGIPKTRHDEDVLKQITVLQQLNIGKIYLDSYLGT